MMLWKWPNPLPKEIFEKSDLCFVRGDDANAVFEEGDVLISKACEEMLDQVDCKMSFFKVSLGGLFDWFLRVDQVEHDHALLEYLWHAVKHERHDSLADGGVIWNAVIIECKRRVFTDRGMHTVLDGEHESLIAIVKEPFEEWTTEFSVIWVLWESSRWQLFLVSD